MLILPAIDLLGGRCVRLYQGDFDKEEVFSDDPAEVAARWESEGAKFLHIVDLDGARQGHSVNDAAIKSILAKIKIPAELGGGIRTLDDVERVLNLGIERVIIGSAAVNDPDMVSRAVQKYGERIAVGIDARNGIVSVAGWEKSGDVSAGELAKKVASLGVKTIIHTDISRDGTLSGANADASREIAKVSGASVVVSGGVSSLNDVLNVKRYETEGLSGIIIGKALYSGKLSFPDALALAE